MKILGLCCGRKMGNSEILVREALMGAEEMGIETKIVRLNDLNIKPCTGCNSCQLSYLAAKSGKCVIKGDDMPFFREIFLDSDGIIIGVPVYELQPPGIFKVLNDRMGPAYEIAFALEAKKLGSTTIDERFFKPRVSGFIAVGGGPHRHLIMALPTMYRFTSSMKIPIVDQMAVGKVAWPGQVLLDETAIERSGKLGRNVARELGKPRENVEWLGEKRGTCPVCHSDVLELGDNNSVTCAACLTQGTIQINGNKISVIFDTTDREKRSWEYGVRHLYTIGEQHQEFEESKTEIQKRLKRYISHLAYSKPHKNK